MISAYKIYTRIFQRRDVQHTWGGGLSEKATNNIFDHLFLHSKLIQQYLM